MTWKHLSGYQKRLLPLYKSESGWILQFYGWSEIADNIWMMNTIKRRYQQVEHTWFSTDKKM